jgi:hypothetical protein
MMLVYTDWDGPGAIHAVEHVPLQIDEVQFPWLRDPSITASGKLILSHLHLSACMHKPVPNMQRLAADLALGARTVYRVVAQLRNAGWLSKDSRTPLRTIWR